MPLSFDLGERKEKRKKALLRATSVQRSSGLSSTHPSLNDSGENCEETTDPEQTYIVAPPAPPAFNGGGRFFVRFQNRILALGWVGEAENRRDRGRATPPG